MYRYFKRITNSIKSTFEKDIPLTKESTEYLDVNPEFINAVSVFSRRLEDRNISSLEKKEDNVS